MTDRSALAEVMTSILLAWKRGHVLTYCEEGELVKIPIAEIESRALRLHEQLKGLEPELQSAVIAHLLATWIAGHRRAKWAEQVAPLGFCNDGEPAIDEQNALAKFREQLLQEHFKLVRDLIPLEDARIDELQSKR